MSLLVFLKDMIFDRHGFILFVIVILPELLIGYYFYNLFQKKRLNGLKSLSQSLGFTFYGSDPWGIFPKYDYHSALKEGDNQYALNVFGGTRNGFQHACFDYHYQTYYYDKYGRHTVHHDFSGILVETPASFEDIFIRPENFFDSLAALVGFHDIEFESAEFNKKFHVKSSDRKFAYEIIHPRMMEFMAGFPPPHFLIDLQKTTILIYLKRKFSPEEFSKSIDFADQFLKLIPEYVWQEFENKKGV